MREVEHGHTWGMSELEWYQLQAELVSLKKRKANAEQELERLEEKQRDVLWVFNNSRVNKRIRIGDFDRWIAEKEEEILEKMMRRN
ncbi:hypothetical protein ACFLXU_02690 [Chloroflexota bacterium]